MGVNEINRIIAEFMGTYRQKSSDGYWLPNPDYLSLDALIPVWEMLGINYFDCDTSHGDNNCSIVLMALRSGDKPTYKTGLIYQKTIYLAAAHATVHAIKELHDES